MSTFFFKTKTSTADTVSGLKTLLEKLQSENNIDNWRCDETKTELKLEVETNKLSSEQLKHLLRETGADVEFAKAPQA